MKTSGNVDALPDSYRGREQTFIKHLILKRYLERVARNVLWSQQEFVFVDGFSGPWASQSGSYEDTSFGIAIRLLRRVREELRSSYGYDRKVRCIFVEKGAAAFLRLSEAIKNAPYIEAWPIKGRFEDSVDEVRRRIGSAFALISIDPKGWSFDIQKLAPLLRHRPSEVIVNFMFEHVNRFLDDKRAKIRDSYALPFGDPNWRSRFDALLKSGLDRETAVLELFREQLRVAGQYEFVLSARIQRPTANRSHFYLVYGTRNRKGLIEFRNVEKKAMEAEEHSRIEAKHDKRAAKSAQGLLHVYSPRSIKELRQPEINKASGWLRERLRRSGAIPYEDAMTGVLERFSITEPELKDLLVAMCKADQVILSGMGRLQRKPNVGVTIMPTPTIST